MMLDIEKESCVELYHNNIPHCHTDLKFKLTPQEVLGTRVTELIDHAFAANVTTVGKMERYFERVGEDIKNIDNDAVQAYLNNLKKAYAPEAPPDNCYTMLDLATFAQKYSEIPNLSVDDNWDMAWVADHYPKLADGDEETKVISNEFSLEFRILRSDITLLQLAPNEEHFKSAITVFNEHWSQYNEFGDFLNYFNDNLVNDEWNNRWYEGAVKQVHNTITSNQQWH